MAMNLPALGQSRGNGGILAKSTKFSVNAGGRICDMGRGREATIEDLYKVEEKAEIVRGEIVRMSASGGLHAYAAFEIAVSLRLHAQHTGRGVAFGDNVGFVVNLPNRRSFSPDAAFWIGGQLTERFLEGAPIFAVAVRSPEDFGDIAERAMAEKRQDYFAAGTLVVWDVDMLRDYVVRVYRATDPHTPSVYARSEIAEAEPAVPGWSLVVASLIPSH
jgi:Uma2 family endonuclease